MRWVVIVERPHIDRPRLVISHGKLSLLNFLNLFLICHAANGTL
jgi:hypothetical protein